MAITNLDGLIAAAKQYLKYLKTAARTTVAGGWFTVFDLAGQPGGGTLAGTSTTAGVVPTSATPGCIPIDAMVATGYLAGVQFGGSVALRFKVYDLLFKAGAYAFNAAVALTLQPSYAARLPGTNYGGLQIWVEAVTAFTGNLTVTITYTNQSGTIGRTATLAAGAALTLGRMMQVPLQAGDTGVQKIDNVVATVATVGTFNVLVLRHLWTARVPLANGGGNDNFIQTGMPVIYANSALYPIVSADSTSSGLIELEMLTADG